MSECLKTKSQSLIDEKKICFAIVNLIDVKTIKPCLPFLSFFLQDIFKKVTYPEIDSIKTFIGEQ